MKFVSEYDSDDINLVVFFYLLSLTFNMSFTCDDF